MSYASTVLADSPVIFLQLDETSGTSAADSGSNGVAWTYQTGVTLGVTAPFSVGGTAINPPGTTPAAVLSTPPASVASPRGTSIEISVNIPTTSLKGEFVDLGNGSNGWSVGVGSGSFDTVGNNLIVLQEGAGWYDTGVQMGTGPHHVIVTNSTAGTISCYLDGTLVKTFTNAGSPSTATSFNLAGVGTRTLPATITVDNLAVYAAVLTQTQVTAHWDAIYVTLPYVAAELSQLTLEVVSTNPSPQRDLSSVSMLTLTASTSPPRQLSSADMQVLTSSNPPRVLSSVFTEVLTPSYPKPKFIGWGLPISQ